MMDDENLTSNDEVDVREDSLGLLQLPRVALVEHVVDAIRVDSDAARRCAGEGGRARNAPVVATLPLRHRRRIAAERRRHPQRLQIEII